MQQCRPRRAAQAARQCRWRPPRTASAVALAPMLPPPRPTPLVTSPEAGQRRRPRTRARCKSATSRHRRRCRCRRCLQTVDPGIRGIGQTRGCEQQRQSQPVNEQHVQHEQYAQQQSQQQSAAAVSSQHTYRTCITHLRLEVEAVVESLHTSDDGEPAARPLLPQPTLETGEPVGGDEE